MISMIRKIAETRKGSLVMWCSLVSTLWLLVVAVPWFTVDTSVSLMLFGALWGTVATNQIGQSVVDTKRAGQSNG